MPHTIIDTPEALSAAAEQLAHFSLLALDTETTGLDPRSDRLRLLTLATAEQAWVVDTWRIPSWQGTIGPLLADPSRTLVAHNAGFDLRFLWAGGLEVRCRWFDTMLASQVVDGGVHLGARGYHALAGLAKRLLDRDLDKGEQVSDWGSQALGPEQLRYAADDALILPALRELLCAQAGAAGLARVVDLECAALPSMAWMEYAGLPFDAAAWAALAAEAEREQVRLTAEVLALLGAELGNNTLFGYHLNLGSPQQVQEALGALGIAVEGTGERELAEVADRHPVVPLLLALRDASKRASTYGVAFARDHVNPATGRIHANYRQIGAISGRMSAYGPNMQNIPRSKAYRACFRAPAGRALVKADFSQIELRCAAVIAPDETMLQAYREGVDLHTLTASSVLGIPIESVTRGHRQLAKSINFGLLYGMGATTLVGYARQGYGVSLSPEEATRHRDAFFATYPGLRRWHRSQPDAPVEVRTLLGRHHPGTAQFTVKLNLPVQGSAADGLKAALARLWAYRHEVRDTQLVATVHDEIVAECPVEEAEAVAAWLTRHMERAMGWVIGGAVPIEVEATIGADWAGTPLPAGPAVPRMHPKFDPPAMVDSDEADEAAYQAALARRDPYDRAACG